YLLYTSAGGVGLVPFLSVVTDSIPANRRGLFFGLRYLLGGLLAFGAGFWVKWVLSDESGMSFPDNYAAVFGVAAVVASVSLVVFCFVREPQHKVETRQLRVGVQLARGLRRVWREPDFRRLLLARISYQAGCGLVFPFLVPYAYQYLHMSEAMVGILVAVRQLCWSTSNLLWSHISDHMGNRPLFVISGALTLSSVLLALAAPFLPHTELAVIWGLHFDYRLVLLLCAFAASGAGNSGQVVAHNSYLLEFTPERTRPVYFGTYYLVLLPLAFLPLPTALLIGVGGRYMSVFIAGALVFALMLSLEARLNPLRDENA
ncbi:MAG: MFS transporter, partial [Armatimonadetes bacterium]|nr:MFS transporter [Armatimonadota bacterium]